MTSIFPEFLANLGCAPAGILTLQADDHRLDRGRQAVRLTEGPAATVGERLEAAIFVAIEDLIPGLAGDAELGAQRRLLAAGVAAEPLRDDLADLVELDPLADGRVRRECDDRAAHAGRVRIRRFVRCA